MNVMSAKHRQINNKKNKYMYTFICMFVTQQTFLTAAESYLNRHGGGLVCAGVYVYCVEKWKKFKNL